MAAFRTFCFLGGFFPLFLKLKYELLAEDIYFPLSDKVCELHLSQMKQRLDEKPLYAKLQEDDE